MSTRPIPLRLARTFIACASFFFLASFVHAANRPIPEIVNIKIFVKNEEGSVDVLMRIPLAAVKDVQFPTRADGDTLDLVALQSMLPGAAKYWVANKLLVSDRGEVLPAPQVAATRIAISSDRSFDSYPSAQMHLKSPDIASSEEVFWRQVWFDIRFVYDLPKGLDHKIAIEPEFADLGVRVTGELTHVRSENDVRIYSFDGELEKVFLDPRWTDTAAQFSVWGGRAVVGGADFLLCLFCLALPFRRYRDFAPSVVTFAGAFAMTLLLESWFISTDAVWFQPLIAALAAVTILLAAFANIVGHVTARRRALFALAAGAVFGLLASSALHAKLQFAADHGTVAGIAFGGGAIIAMIGVNALLIPIVTALFAFARVEYIERIIVSALAADTAWLWFSERSAHLAKIPFQFDWDASMWAPMLKVLTLFILLSGLMWFANAWLKSYRGADEEQLQKNPEASA